VFSSSSFFFFFFPPENKGTEAKSRYNYTKSEDKKVDLQVKNYLKMQFLPIWKDVSWIKTD